MNALRQAFAFLVGNWRQAAADGAANPGSSAAFEASLR